MFIDPEAASSTRFLRGPKGVWIGGEEVTTDQTFTSVDPTTEEALAEIATAREQEIEAAAIERWRLGVLPSAGRALGWLGDLWLIQRQWVRGGSVDLIEVALAHDCSDDRRAAPARELSGD